MKCYPCARKHILRSPKTKVTFRLPSRPRSGESMTKTEQNRDDCTRTRELKIYDACNQASVDFRSRFHWHLEAQDMANDCGTS